MESASRDRSSTVRTGKVEAGAVAKHCFAVGGELMADALGMGPAVHMDGALTLKGCPPGGFQH